ncbi:MAG: YraN family protein [Timaviella obliquedivisa GSE-PSE-MK23-08B]|jgi:putative endonuclease|nr:YraN family protein [Timaviella obliquedivisa GSE-PSE-MK23-08B]
MLQPSSGKAVRQAALAKGTLAEALVAQWLIEQGWEILEERWHCSMGELDLVAYRSPRCSDMPANLAFVEVKARSSGNWDANGMLAVNAQKQIKLWRSAQLFLATYPALANVACSFDVALVHCRRVTGQTGDGLKIPSPVELGKAVAIAGYFLTLKQYIPAAFDAIET